MSSLFTLPFADVGNGISPSDGAQLFFFETDQVTPKDTFTTAEATVAHSNPVEANSAGVFPEIWLVGSYVAVLKDKNGVQQWQSQEFSSTIANSDLTITKATISAAKADDDLQNFIGGYVRVGDINELYKVENPGTGTTDDVIYRDSDTSNLFQLRLIVDGVLSVLAAGADPTGVTDSTTAFQNALDTKYPIYIPKGRYRITSTITTPVGVTHMHGDGAHQVDLINEVSTGTAVLAINGTGAFPTGRNGSFKGFRIVDDTGTHGIGITLLASAAWNHFEDVECWSCEYGVTFTQFNIANVFTKCTFKANRTEGVLDPVHASAAEESVACSFHACNIEQSPICVNWNSGQTYFDGGCVIEAFTTYGIVASKAIQVTGCYFETVDNNTIAIRTTGAGNVIMGNSILLNAATSSIGVQYNGINNAIIGNTFGGSGAGSFDISNNAVGNTASCIMGNNPSGLGTDIATDTNTTFIQGANAQFNQVLLTALGQFGGGTTDMIGNFEPTTNDANDFGGASNAWRNVYANQFIPDKIGYASFQPAASMNNNTLFVDSADNKLKWKDSTGTVQLLY